MIPIRASIAAVALATLVGCSPFQVTEQAATTTTTSTTTTTTTTTTLPPPRPPTQGCHLIDTGDVSTLVPDDWNEWCAGAENFASILLDDGLDVWCDGFWETSDNDILDVMVYELGWGRDRSIGAIDVLWTVC